MAFSESGSTTSVRPDKPLIVKCIFDQRMKRITFTSSRNCSYDLLRARVEQCFALSATSFTICYKDDDGEVTDITSDGDLTEAIHYFHVGDDFPASSASSVVSGRSISARKVTLRLSIVVDYELSLSDTASMTSQEEYDHLNASELTLAREPLNGSHQESEGEDDSVTVSSYDMVSIPQGVSALRVNSRQNLRSLSPVPSDGSSPTSFLDTVNASHEKENASKSTTHRAKSKAIENVLHSSSTTLPSTVVEESAKDQHTSGQAPDVFDRLRRLEEAKIGDPYAYQDPKRLSQSDRGVQWLRDQNVRAIQSMFGTLPEPSVAGDTESQLYEDTPKENIVGDLALQQDPRGKYYYTYTSSSGTSQLQEESSDLPQDGGSVVDSIMTVDETNAPHKPSPHGLAWLADQQAHPSSSAPESSNPFRDPSPSRLRERYQIHPDIPPEVLKFIPEHRLPLLPPEPVTHCSACGVMLESFRYVCTTCGERDAHPRESLTLPDGKGKGKDTTSNMNNPFLYPSHFQHPMSTSPSSSSRTLINPSELPPRTSSLQPPSGQSSFYIPRALAPSPSQDTLLVPPFVHSLSLGTTGFELCTNCIESAGVLHALEAGVSGSPHGGSPLSSSQEDIQALFQLRRTAPLTKGHIRHAYREKVWGREGWKDVEQDDVPNCVICKTSLQTDRYKCASCSKFDLCRACYSQVHEIHPLHAFLSIPDQSSSSRYDEASHSPRRSLDMNGEPSLRHPGVKCDHCMLDIVGARFHCAVCESVDICSNCESAGLPGNLTSPDGGHDSSHIMIKIPYPLESTEVETASRRAISLWHIRDRPELQRPGGRRRSDSQDSAHARTVVGARTVNGGPHSRHGSSHNEHHLPCRVCCQTIVGIRYQCASCPSLPTSYNLCAACEVQSYLVHDPGHIFIKIPRALDRQIQTPYPLLPLTLYSCPAGSLVGPRNDPRIDPRDPRAYIQLLYHRSAVCDRCIEHIRGIWLHCAYCGSDLCEDCEAVGAHDRTHVFLVFKSIVNMTRLGEICDIEDPSQSPPIIPHPVYMSS